MKKMLLLLLLVLFLSACVKVADADSSKFYWEKISESGNYDTYRMVDSEWNTVCYRYGWGGIDCVPLSQTGVDY